MIEEKSPIAIGTLEHLPDLSDNTSLSFIF